MEVNGWCHSTEMMMADASLAAVNGIIAITAAIQVFHCMIIVSNFGYFLYFLLNPIATCRGWKWWSSLWGFVISAGPDIVFLTIFLLLLSFWADLYHQATDDDEEEEEGEEEQILPSVHSQTSKSFFHCTRCIQLPHIRGRQQLVVQMVMGLCLLTVAFTGLIWYGIGDNNIINSARLAQVHADVFAIVILLTGGGLAAYGLLLYNKMCRVKMTSKASADSHKVATLAAASVVCFSVHAFLALFFDNSFIIIWNLEHVESQLSAPLILLYYLTGEAIPSLVVLWVMRDMPSQLQDPSLSCHPMQDNLIENGLEQALIPDTGLVPQWVSSPSGQQYLVFLGQPSNHISQQESKVVKDSSV